MPTEQALSEGGEMFVAEGDLGAKRNVVEVGVVEDGQLGRCLAAAPESATEISGKPEPTIEVISGGNADATRIGFLIRVDHRIDGVQPGIGVDVRPSAKELKLGSLLLRTRSISQETQDHNQRHDLDGQPARIAYPVSRHLRAP